MNELESEIQKSIDYLKSEKALKSLASDSYWPKWDSPWWHMLLLHEMGETKRIPEITIEKYIEKLNQIALKVFPLLESDFPAGLDPYRDNPCHCQLGTVYQVLSAWGIAVDEKLPWIRPWLLSYQMKDGGLNCDHLAYRVQNETPSSMVGTISVFEAILFYTPRAFTPEETEFLNRGAAFLIQRELRLGSSTLHNAEEKNDEKDWLELCFPRFYFYDVLRGLHALISWSEKFKKPLSLKSIQVVKDSLSTRFPDGEVQIGRRAYEGIRTLQENAPGEWGRSESSPTFPLLLKCSEIGNHSPVLSKQWKKIQSSN